MPGKASGHENLTPIPVDNCLRVTGLLADELTVVEGHQRLIVYTGANFQL